MTQLLDLALKCITFTVGQFITFSVKMYYIYGAGGSANYISR